MKNYFMFDFFDSLNIGDVFKFSPFIDNDIPSRFYTVYSKDESTTKINATYGKNLYKQEYVNSLPREIMIFPNRRK